MATDTFDIRIGRHVNLNRFLPFCVRLFKVSSVCLLWEGVKVPLTSVSSLFKVEFRPAVSISNPESRSPPT